MSQFKVFFYYYILKWNYSYDSKLKFKQSSVLWSFRKRSNIVIFYSINIYLYKLLIKEFFLCVRVKTMMHFYFEEEEYISSKKEHLFKMENMK